MDCIPSEGFSHSIGTVRSAPDGSLYVGSGDAASFSKVDPLALRTYDERSMAGKILRVDRNGRGLANHAFCPTETDTTRVCTKLYAKGFRNPFRFKVRPDGAGLTVGDVGWDTREEVDLIRSGGRSYGWPCYEGTTRTYGYKDLSQCSPEYAKEGTAQAHVGPNHDYAHNGSSSILGGPTYTGDQYPTGYRDSIFFADYSAGFVKRLEVDSQDRVTAVRSFATGWSGTDLELTPQGDVAYVRFGSGDFADGEVVRIAYSPGNGTPVARASGSPTSGSTPLIVAFDASASSDPDGDALTYRWDFGDGTQGTGAKVSHRYDRTGAFTARVTVDDGRGRTNSTTVAINVGGSKPVARIEAPADGSLFRAGTDVTLRGSATDAQDGNLPASAFAWTVTLYHGTHTHVVTQPQGVTQTTFRAVSDHDADSYYQITLRVTDSSGETDTKTATIRPETVSFGIASSPAGAPVSYAGTGRTAPFTTTSAIGFATTVTAAASFVKDGRTYAFDRWSDGGARVHDITIPATGSTLTATYRDTGPANGPVLALGFDDGSGSTVRDSSGQGNAGSIRGATWTAGKYGSALSFDGIDDWVTVPDSASLDVTTAFTLEAWVNPRAITPWDMIFIKEAPGSLAYGLYADSGGGNSPPSGWVAENGTYATTRLPLNTWTHLAIAYENNTARLYVNGTLVSTDPYVPATTASTGPLRIGGNAIWTDEFLDGRIDEIRIYDRALTTTQITTDMNTAVNR